MILYFPLQYLAAYFFWEFLPNINGFSYAGVYFSVLLLPPTDYTPTITTAYKHPNIVSCFRPPCCCIICLEGLLSPLTVPCDSCVWLQLSQITSPRIFSLIFQKNYSLPVLSCFLILYMVYCWAYHIQLYFVYSLLLDCEFLKNILLWDFPGGAVVENLPANAGDTGSSPGLGRSHMPRSN